MKSVVIFLLLTVLVPSVQAEVKEFPARGIDHLEIENQLGNIKVMGDEGADKITVTADKIRFDKNCRLEIKQQKKVIEVQNETPSFFNNANCEVNFTVKVPATIDLSIKNSRGDISVSDTKGKLEIKLASGDVRVRSVVQDFDVKAAKGNIDAQGLTGNASIKIGSGNILLVYGKDPLKGEVDIKAGSGDASVFFPPKTRLQSKVLVGSGEGINELGDFNDAKFLVSFKAGSGTLKIKESTKLLQ